MPSALVEDMPCSLRSRPNPNHAHGLHWRAITPCDRELGLLDPEGDSDSPRATWFRPAVRSEAIGVRPAVADVTESAREPWGRMVVIELF